MATSSTYYLDAPSLESATSIFINSELSTCAPDGFFSNGIITREQVNCVLLPQQNCPGCSVLCDNTIQLDNGTQAVYLLDVNTGSTASDIGAILVRFNPASIPDGIVAVFNNSSYNLLSSALDGGHKSTTPTNPTYLGASGSDCGISGTTYVDLTQKRYDTVSNLFIDTGLLETITVNTGDVSLSAITPSTCLMVIPKITATPSIINFKFISPCTSASWSIKTECPVVLPSFASSVVAVDATAVCLLNRTETYYYASVNTSTALIDLYDFVFADSFGSTKLNEGYYYALGKIEGQADWFRVDANGIVVELNNCIQGNPCGTNINANGSQGLYKTEIEAGVDVGAIIIRFDPIDVPDGIIVNYNGKNYNLLTATLDGAHKSSAPGVQATYVGSLASDCGLVANSPYTLNVFEFDGTNYVGTGSTQNISVFQQQLSLTSNNQPGNCMMVIPKTNTSPSVVTITTIGACSGTLFDLTVNCPVLLTGFTSSVVSTSSALACPLAQDKTYYNASLTNNSGIVKLHDFVYFDAYGVQKLTNGFYSSPNITGGNEWFEVDSNGVVIQLGTC
jgi:hypothetical protein